MIHEGVLKDHVSVEREKNKVKMVKNQLNFKICYD